MAYVKPTKRQVEAGLECGWNLEQCERGYAIMNFNGLGLLEIEAIGDVYLSVDGDEGYDDEACAIEAERSGFCKIIPVNELPNPFIIDGIDRRWFGWVDTPENRKAIADYVNNTMERNNMATWTQYTYVNGELKYEPKKRSADDMVGLFAQMHFLKQAGDDITVNADTDDEWNITEYKVIRTLKGKKLFYRFVKG